MTDPINKDKELRDRLIEELSIPIDLLKSEKTGTSPLRPVYDQFKNLNSIEILRELYMSRLIPRDEWLRAWQERRISPYGRMYNVTEEEWLSTNNPNLMYSYINDGTEGWQFSNNVNERTNQYFVDACEWICCCRNDRSKVINPLTAERWSQQIDNPACECTQKVRAHLIREIYGNPFRPIVREVDYLINPLYHAIVRSTCIQIARDELSRLLQQGAKPYTVEAPNKERWTVRRCRELNSELVFRDAWMTPDVLSFLQKIDEDGDYASLPIFADLLDEVGCSNKYVLDHCRGLVPYFDAYGKITEYRVNPSFDPLHVKGCWVVELLKRYVEDAKEVSKEKDKAKGSKRTRKIIDWQSNEKR